MANSYRCGRKIVKKFKREERRNRNFGVLRVWST
jgi:hypothetical protein